MQTNRVLNGIRAVKKIVFKSEEKHNAAPCNGYKNRFAVAISNAIKDLLTKSFLTLTGFERESETWFLGLNHRSIIVRPRLLKNNVALHYPKLNLWMRYCLT